MLFLLEQLLLGLDLSLPLLLQLLLFDELPLFLVELLQLLSLGLPLFGAVFHLLQVLRPALIYHFAMLLLYLL